MQEVPKLIFIFIAETHCMHTEIKKPETRRGRSEDDDMSSGYIRCKEGARRFRTFGLCKNSQVPTDHCCPACNIYLYRLKGEERKLIDNRLIPKLSPTKINDFKAILHATANSGDLVIDKFNVTLRQSHLSCLREGEWLNDEVINFVIMMIRERYDKFTMSLLKQCF